MSMISDDTKLRLLKGELVPRSNVVYLLEDLLSKARLGQIIAVGAAYEYNDATYGYGVAHAEGSTPVGLVGEMEVMQQAVVARKCLGGS